MRAPWPGASGVPGPPPSAQMGDLTAQMGDLTAQMGEWAAQMGDLTEEWPANAQLPPLLPRSLICVRLVASMCPTTAAGCRALPVSRRRTHQDGWNSSRMVHAAVLQCAFGQEVLLTRTSGRNVNFESCEWTKLGP
ncbi:hypothetical protein GCM10028789_04270 [Sinomonas halotolerans]